MVKGRTDSNAVPKGRDARAEARSKKKQQLTDLDQQKQNPPTTQQHNQPKQMEVTTDNRAGAPKEGAVAVPMSEVTTNPPLLNNPPDHQKDVAPPNDQAGTIPLSAATQEPGRGVEEGSR